jgi:hypothetical protein
LIERPSHRHAPRSAGGLPPGAAVPPGPPDPLEATRAAIDSGAGAVFEACFEFGGVFCAVDVIERNGDEWTLIEVKSSSSVKEYHYPDVAVQVFVARQCGLNVTRAELMHLNREYRHPQSVPLFVRSDVTEEVERLQGEIPGRIAEQLAVLERRRKEAARVDAAGRSHNERHSAVGEAERQAEAADQGAA